MYRLLIALLLSTTFAASAQTTAAPAAAEAQNHNVLAQGAVPDEATKATVLERPRALYGADRVVDQLEVGGVVTPANWSKYVSNMIGDHLKQVSSGQLQIQGNTIDISGEVADTATGDQVVKTLSKAFDRNYNIHQHWRIGNSKQLALDQALADRTIQFESGSATLTSAGRNVLDEMAAAIRKLDQPQIQIVGNTDNIGERQSNIALSLSRANAVKDYLATKGIPAATLAVSGRGPDNPIADNGTTEGRARNRRIDFKITGA